MQRGRIATNPAKRIDAPTPGRFAPDLVSVDDARRLIRAAEADTENGARWMLAISLGLRQGERLALGRDRLDLTAHTLKIDRELYRLPWQHGCHSEPCGKKRGADCPARHGGGLFVGDPKSDAGVRTLVMPPQLENAIKRHLRAQDSIRAEEGEGWTGFTSANGVELEPVFCQRNGRAIDARRDHADWKAFLEKAGVPEVRLHDARHTAATVLLLMGVDGRVVMDMMGWSQASMLKRYQHVIDEMKRDAAEKMGQALWAPDDEPQPAAPPEVVSMDDYRRRRAR
ncbi:tyrosine-type recombinase/integrase [Sinomonas sp. P47F7]|uniref:tyrosine-type recombinase/integrase n=1 Tax=Sinomonas sp. P47F7 TaxID=3410987 RepID=UPI003BF463A6